MKISVIIPVYNCEDYIEQSVRSAASQKYVHEVLVINDGSDDNTAAIVERMASRYKTVQLLSHFKNKQKGRSQSRNLGVQHARYEWIAFLDADDYYLDSRFVHLAERVNDNIDGFYDPIETVYQSEELKQIFTEKITGISQNVAPKDLFDFLIQQSEQRISLNGLIVKKKCLLNQGGFDDSFELGEDSDLILRLALNCRLQHGSLANPKAIRRVHNNNSFYDHDKVRFYRHRFYKKWLDSSVPMNKNSRRMLLRKYLSTSKVAVSLEKHLWLYRLVKAGHFLRYKLTI